MATRRKPAKRTAKRGAPDHSTTAAAATGATSDGAPGPRPFWSGTISFGLVAVPVQLFPSTRSAGPTTRMLALDGTPIERRWVCGAEDRDVDASELVRGFEIAPDQHVVVTDEELDAIEPRKSRDIDLRLFTAIDTVDPLRFEKAYVLVPAGDTAKPYRLLATVMEQEGKAGIATFVMRDREQLVAILARNGILWAETLRFADELRDADAEGVPRGGDAPDDLTATFAAALRDLGSDPLDAEHLRARLRDPRLDRLQQLVDAKREQGTDILVARRTKSGARAAAPADEDGDPGDDVPDLFEVIRARLRGEQGRADPAPAGDTAANPRRRQARSTRRGLDAELAKLSKAELYERAKRADLPGRSEMTKGELIDALRRRA